MRIYRYGQKLAHLLDSCSPISSIMKELLLYILESLYSSLELSYNISFIYYSSHIYHIPLYYIEYFIYLFYIIIYQNIIYYNTNNKLQYLILLPFILLSFRLCILMDMMVQLLQFFLLWRNTTIKLQLVGKVTEN